MAHIVGGRQAEVKAGNVLGDHGEDSPLIYYNIVSALRIMELNSQMKKAHLRGAVRFPHGRIALAPGWMRERGLEWLFRLTMEPRRLSRRHLVYGTELRYWCC